MSDSLTTPETGTAPVLAVIIPHYNDVARLQACLSALNPQLGAAGAAVETLVADNDSPADLAPLAAAFPRVRFVTEPQKGAAAARNRGAAETTAPVLAFLDSDCVPAQDWLATALRLATAGTGAAEVIGGRVDTFDETPPPRSGAEAFETVFAFHQQSYIETKGFSVTANLLVPRHVFDAVGPMQVGVSEDVDWCHRATAAGVALRYAGDWVVAHPTRQDWAALARKWRRTTEEGFRLNGTGLADRTRWAVRALAVAGSGPAHLPKVLASSRLAPGERVAAASTLLRLRTARAAWMLGQALSGA